MCRCSNFMDSPKFTECILCSLLDTGDTKVAKASAHKTKVSANNHTNVKLLSVTNGTRKSYTMTGKPLAKAFFS